MVRRQRGRLPRQGDRHAGTDVLRKAVDRPPLPHYRFLANLVVVAHDDLDRPYLGDGPYGTIGLGMRFDFSMSIQPSPDAGATAMTSAVQAIEWRRLPPLRDRTPEYSETGTWTFVVPLAQGVLATEVESE